jgi:hypothetical protein
MTDRPASDPIRHTQHVREKLQDLANHLRKDVEEIDEPQAMALFETSAEVLDGLRRSFEHYEEKNEAAWQPSA